MRYWIILVASLVPITTLAQDSRYASDPQLLGAGARPLGMGGAFTAISDDATAVYWNAAGLTQMTRNEIHAQHSEQFGGTVNHDLLTLGFPSQYGAFGIGLTRFGTDGITLTDLERPDQPITPGNRPFASGTVRTSDYTLALGFALPIRDSLSIGGTLKMIWRNLSVGDGTGYGLDIGVHYTNGPWRLGAFLRDATKTKITFDSGSSDRVPQSLAFGIAYSRRIDQMHGSILMATSVDLSEETSAVADGQRFRLGAEYTHESRISARMGIEENHFTAGAGLEPMDRMRIDIAFLENGDLDNTYRISAALYF